MTIWEIDDGVRVYNWKQRTIEDHRSSDQFRFRQIFDIMHILVVMFKQLW